MSTPNEERLMAVPNHALLFLARDSRVGTCPVQFVSVNRKSALVTSGSQVLPGESFSICLVDPIRSEWVSCGVVGAELAGSGPYHFELIFTELLPDDFLNALAVPILKATVGPSANPAGVRRLLVVDDHEETQAVVAEIFRRRGFTVETAGTLAEGMQWLDPPPCCIILDLMLPDGPGERILQWVRDAGLPSRVAVYTGVADPQRLAQVRRLRPDDLLSKPIDLSHVFDDVAVAGKG